MLFYSNNQTPKLFMFTSKKSPLKFRKFPMISGTAADFSLAKISSRTNWRTSMVGSWEPHLSTSHPIHTRLGFKCLHKISKFSDRFSKLKIALKIQIYLVNSPKMLRILDPLGLCRQRREAGLAGSTSSWKLWPQTSTLPWTFSPLLTGSSGERTRTDHSLVSHSSKNK